MEISRRFFLRHTAAGGARAAERGGRPAGGAAADPRTVQAIEVAAGGPSDDRMVKTLVRPTPERDETLQHPRCIFQLVKRHFARYTPDMVERVTGCPRETFVKVADALPKNSGPDKTTSFAYAVAWTQHTCGPQIIGAAALLQRARRGRRPGRRDRACDRRARRSCSRPARGDVSAHRAPAAPGMRSGMEPADRPRPHDGHRCAGRMAPGHPAARFPCVARPRGPSDDAGPVVAAPSKPAGG